MEKSSSKNFTKTKLVIFDINFDDQMLSNTTKQDDLFKKTIQLLVSASINQHLVILTDNFLHDVIRFCKHNKINHGWIIACNRTVIYDLKTKTYLASSFLDENSTDLAIHLASLYAANLFFYTTKHKIVYWNNLVIQNEKIKKYSKISPAKSFLTLKKKIKNEKIFNIFLIFGDGFKISDFFLKIKDYFAERCKNYSYTTNEKSLLEIIDKKTIIFRNQITAANAIWTISKKTNIFAKSNILYYPINRFNMPIYLQCRHHVLDKSLYTPPPQEKKHIFCIDKPSSSLTNDFGATANNFWKNEK